MIFDEPQHPAHCQMLPRVMAAQKLLRQAALLKKAETPANKESK